MAQALTLSRPPEGLKSRAAELWRSYPRETLGLGLLAVTIALAIGGTAYSTPELPNGAVSSTLPPAPPPLLVRQIAPEQALALNQQIPLVDGPNPAARPFAFTGNAATRARALECLASAVYYEAGSQDSDGQRAVAQVVLNRVRHPAFPASVCDVVYQGSTRATGCQFTFTCDGSLYRRPDEAGWRRAYRIAQDALSGSVYAPVGYATHYHANYVVPYWASTLAKNAVVGAHIFYRWAGGWGRPTAFAKGYSGREPNVDALRSAAIAAEAALGNGTQGSEVTAAVAEIPGAEALPLTPSMRGDKRVAIRFNLAARTASAKAPHSDYVERVEASDNLRWSLSNEIVAADEKPLGKPAAKPASGGSAGGAAIASAER
jgi:spore germination cell wall hydrolase CwlJ-like protein